MKRTLAVEAFICGLEIRLRNSRAEGFVGVRCRKLKERGCEGDVRCERRYVEWIRKRGFEEKKGKDRKRRKGSLESKS